ncbi:MAG: hypothetical protein ACD_46C00263G0001 [uncultured bacterium]|nr:MAG: hypothetical protein ACD_46C00263G0001 [uncultured bacterium]
MTAKSILMICQGNICRSPMAEGFFSHQLNQSHSSITINSAGLAAVVNYPAEPKAHSIMQKYGIDISKHRARQLTDTLVREAELIFVMTKRQLAALEHKYLFVKGKAFLLGYWQNFEIQDPVNQSIDAFEKVYQQIEMAWQDWKTRIL